MEFEPGRTCRDVPPGQVVYEDAGIAEGLWGLGVPRPSVGIFTHSGFDDGRGPHSRPSSMPRFDGLDWYDTSDHLVSLRTWASMPSVRAVSRARMWKIRKWGVPPEFGVRIVTSTGSSRSAVTQTNVRVQA